MRNSVAPLGARHARGPDLRMLLHVIIRADYAVFKFHFSLRTLNQPVQSRRIAVKHFFPLGIGYTGQRMFDGIPGIWIGGSNMREVRFPKDVVDADAVAQFDTDGFEPEIDVDLTPE